MSSTKDPSIPASASHSHSGEEEARLEILKCYVCGRQFDDMAEMQRHTLTEHMQRADLPKEQEQ
jgi:hypothetical protein